MRSANSGFARREGLLHALLAAEVGGDRLNDDEVTASIIVTMVGGQETTMNLIGNGMLTLAATIRTVAEDLRNDPSLIQSAVEELLRYESPSQHTARLAQDDIELGGKLIRKRQAVYAVMGAANRDPERFPDPDRLDIHRKDNRHVAFGFGAHFCFGAPLARLEAQVPLPPFCAGSRIFNCNRVRFPGATTLGSGVSTRCPCLFPANRLKASQLEYGTHFQLQIHGPHGKPGRNQRSRLR